jgi:hypothetical protein
MDSAQEVLKQMGAPVDFEEIYFSEVCTIVHCMLFYRGGQNDDFRPLTYILGRGAWGAGTDM